MNDGPRNISNNGDDTAAAKKCSFFCVVPEGRDRTGTWPE